VHSPVPRVSNWLVRIIVRRVDSALTRVSDRLLRVNALGASICVAFVIHASAVEVGGGGIFVFGVGWRAGHGGVAAAAEGRSEAGWEADLRLLV
jgi:small neutral amino acid transporter SnatA (MarC family)